MKRNGIILILAMVIMIGMVKKNNTRKGNELLMIPIVDISIAKEYSNISKGMIIQNKKDENLYRYNGDSWSLLTDLQESKSIHNLAPNSGTITIDDVLQLKHRSTQPFPREDGMIYFNDTFDILYICADGLWRILWEEEL